MGHFGWENLLRGGQAPKGVDHPGSPPNHFNHIRHLLWHRHSSVPLAAPEITRVNGVRQDFAFGPATRALPHPIALGADRGAEPHFPEGLLAQVAHLAGVELASGHVAVRKDAQVCVERHARRVGRSVAVQNPIANAADIIAFGESLRPGPRRHIALDLIPQSGDLPVSEVAEGGEVADGLGARRPSPLRGCTWR